VTWAMGPNFNNKFRVAPWLRKTVALEAAESMRKDGDLGILVHRSGGGVCEFFPWCSYVDFPMLYHFDAKTVDVSLLHLHCGLSAHLRPSVYRLSHRSGWLIFAPRSIALSLLAWLIQKWANQSH